METIRIINLISQIWGVLIGVIGLTSLFFAGRINRKSDRLYANIVVANT